MKKQTHQTDLKSLLTAVWNSSTDAMRITDSKGKIFDVNEAFCTLTGMKKESLIGKKLDIIYDKKDSKRIIKEYNKFLAGDKLFERKEKILTFANGKKYILESSYSQIEMSGEKYILGVFRNITETKRKEDILNARSRLLLFANSHTLDELLEETLNEVEKLTESLIGFYHFVDPDQNSLTLQNWSTQTKKLFCKAEGKGLHYEIDKAGVWVDCVHTKNPVIHNDYASLSNKKGLPPGHATVIRELVVPVKRGEKIMAILGIGNKSGDYDNQDINIVSLFADLAWEIAERKLVEEQLESRNTLLTSIINNSSDIIILSLDNKYSYINFNEKHREEMKKIWNVDIRIGMNILDCMQNPELRKLAKQSIDRTLKGEVFSEIQFQPGSNIYYELIWSPILKNEIIISVTLFIRDITDRITKEQKEIHLASIVESSEDAIIGKSLDGIITSWNKGAENIYGYSETEMIGQPISVLIPKNRKEDFLQILYKIKSGENIAHYETVRLRKDGNEIYISLTVSPILDSEGKIIAASSIARDITERKKTEEKLRITSLYARSLIEASLDPLVTISPDGKITDVNKATEMVTGVLREHLINSDFSDYFTEPEKARDGYRSVLTNGLVRDYPLTIQHSSGKKTEVLYNATIYKNESGQLQGIFAAARDITERNLIENALAENEKKYRELFESAPDAIFLAEIETGKIIDANPTACKLLQKPLEEIIGLNQTELHPSNFGKYSKQIFEEHIRANIEGLTVEPIEHFVARSDGTNVPVEILAKKIILDGKPILQGIFRDITERRRAEEDRLIHLRFFENMDKINRAIQETQSLEQMMSNVLEKALAIFDCDRSWLFYPCDPDASVFRVPMEITKPEYPGAGILNEDISLPPDMAEDLKEVLKSAEPLTYIAGTDRPINKISAEQFDVKSMMMIALYPKSGKPWVFGLHQCSNARYWTNEEKRLFQEISRRLCDSLSSLLILHDLKESEERYRIIAENTADTISVFDLNLKQIYVSPSIQRLLGYTTHEVLLKPLNELLTPESFQKVETVFAEQMSLESKGKADPSRTNLLELQEYRRDGSVIWVELTATFLRDQNLKPTGILTVTREITERKKAEKEITRINRTLRMLSDSNQALIHITDEETLLKEVCKIIVDIGGYLMAWVGFAENDEAKTLRSVANAGINSGYIESAKVSWGNNERGQGPGGIAIRTGRPYIVRDIPNDPAFITWRDAAIQRGFKSIIALPLIIEDKVFGAMGIYSGEIDAFDIKEVEILEELAGDLSFGIDTLRIKARRDQSEEELRKLSAAVEQSPLTIFITDLNGKIVYANPKTYEITGYQVDELIGKNPNILKSGLMSNEVYKELWETISSSKVWLGEFHNKKKNGELYWEYASISPIINKDGIVTHYLAIKEDITERKKMIDELIIAKDKAEEISRLKTNFLANMSHEIRTPLSGILGFSSILKSELKDPKHLEYTNAIERSGQRLLETLNLILDFSKLEAEKIDVNYSNIPVELVIEEVIKSFESMAMNKNLFLKKNILENNLIINIDERFLRQILNNLVNNAIKYTNNGGITVELVKEKNTVAIKVKDTGIGIAKDKYDLIFEEFRQESEGYSRSFEGTGLGLSITKKFVELMKGIIKLESEVGIGTTFIVEFPFVKTSVINTEIIEKVEPVNEMPVYVTSSEKKFSVLLVEDDEINRNFTIEVIKDYYIIETVGNGYEALEKVKKRTFDIILMDINLGKGMNGIETVNKIRKLSEYEKTPVVALTAFVLPGDREEFISGGCTHYLDKPFTKNQILKLLKNISENIILKI